MSSSDGIESIKGRVIPVLVIEDASWSIDLASTLVESGLPVVEVTLRTKASWDAIESMRKVSGLTLGVGSVSKSSDLVRAKELKVDFAVSAGIRSEKSLSIGLAHGALAMTTPGDTSMATLEEVLKLADGGSARVQR